MKKPAKILLLAVLSILLVHPTSGQSKPDIVSALLTAGDSGRSIGLQKLSASERSALNELLNRLYELGAGRGSLPVPGQAPQAPGKPPETAAYISKVESESNGVVRLENGAIAEVMSGYVGYAGYRRDAALIVTGASCRLWVKGKRVFRCSLIKPPGLGRPRSAVESSIVSISGNGSLIKLLDGTFYEVSSLHTLHTALWLPVSNVLVLDDVELINLDGGDEIVTVRRIR